MLTTATGPSRALEPGDGPGRFLHKTLIRPDPSRGFSGLHPVLGLKHLIQNVHFLGSFTLKGGQNNRNTPHSSTNYRQTQLSQQLSCCFLLSELVFNVWLCLLPHFIWTSLIFPDKFVLILLLTVVLCNLACCRQTSRYLAGKLFIYRNTNSFTQFEQNLNIMHTAMCKEESMTRILPIKHFTFSLWNWRYVSKYNNKTGWWI